MKKISLLLAVLLTGCQPSKEVQYFGQGNIVKDSKGCAFFVRQSESAACTLSVRINFLAEISNESCDFNQ